MLMLENHRSAFLWNLMKRCAAIRTGLLRAGFSNGWLAATGDTHGREAHHV